MGGSRTTADRDAPAVAEGRSSVEGGRATANVHRPAAEEDHSSVVDGSAPVTVFRWACPICGESRTGMASGEEDPRGKAEFSLRQHVKTSDDDGHGPANVYPAGFDPDAAGSAVSVD